MQKTAKVHEIFISMQGEGIFCGKRQLFVRFFGCNLKCAFCDTPQDLKEARDYTGRELIAAVQKISLPQDIHSVSLTGGEPLLHSGFLRAVLPILKQAGYRIYLETNGTLPERLAEVIDFVNITAMDIKLPSSSGMGSFWKEHGDFLATALKKEVFVKLVVTAQTTTEDFCGAVNLIKSKSPYIALALQPVTPQSDAEAVKPQVLEKFKNIAAEHLHKVKIVPQTHKLLGIR